MTALAATPPTLPDSAALPRAGWFTQFGQVLRRWLTSTWRQVWGPVMSIIQPIVWILLFGSVFSSLGTLPHFGSGNYNEYLVPGVLMMTVLYSGAWAGNGYLEDMGTGVMDQYLTLPVSRSAIVSGQLAQQLIINLAQSLVVLGIGWLAGARYPGGVVGVLVALGLATVLAAIFCCLSTALALTARSQVALIGIAQIVVLPVTFLSSAMMPIALLPGWVAEVARWNPMSWAVGIARGGLSGDFPAEAWWQLGGLLALAVLAFAGALRSFRSYQRSV